MKKLIIAIVIYQPDLTEFQSILANLYQAMMNLVQQRNFAIDLYLLDNSPTHVHVAKIEQIFASLNQENKKIRLFIHKNSDNPGYGKANNRVIHQQESDYYLAMNPDVTMPEDSLIKAVDYMEQHPQYGLLGPAVFSPDGERQYFCKQNPTLVTMFIRSSAPSVLKKLFAKKLYEYEMRHKNYEEEMENVPFLSGCFLFFRMDVLKKIGGYDPDYFLYFEDADICRRTHQVSQTIYYPQIRITHEWSRATHTNKYLRKIAIKSGLTYWRKWGGIY